MKTERLHSLEDHDWLQLRMALWPDGSRANHLAEMAAFLAEPERFGQFLVRSIDGSAVGLAEVSLRSDHVNGTHSSPVAFLEGLYVRPTARRQGAARALVDAAKDWGRSKGCSELASDTAPTNRTSRAVHRRLGFDETEQVVYFCLPLQ